MLKIEKAKEKRTKESSKMEVYRKIQELAAKGLIRPASGKPVEISMPPKFPGKPLSEYLKEIRE